MPRQILPTGPGTSPSNDVSDPHPSDEEHYDREERPFGATPPKRDIGPNPAAHDGTPGRPPKNVETDPDGQGA